jgi:superfamily I DNA and/or RNA helicase
VAFTRARKKLLVVGDSATWGRDAFFSAWLAWVESQGGYKSAWDYLY